MMGKIRKIDDLDVADRVARAKTKTIALVNQTIDLINLQAANNIIVYSPTLSSQIPKSHAAVAFNVFQDGLLKFQIVRLCALLDSCAPDDLAKESIPAVARLINNPTVLASLTEERRQESLYAGERVAAERSNRAATRLRHALALSKHLENGTMMKAMRNFRDRHVAHSLEQTRLEQRETVANMKYGYERLLLKRAIMLVDRFYLAINGVGFAWSASVEIARSNAAALWEGTTFKVRR